jgi:hypothetical protein
VWADTGEEGLAVILRRHSATVGATAASLSLFCVNLTASEASPAVGGLAFASEAPTYRFATKLTLKQEVPKPIGTKPGEVGRFRGALFEQRRKNK